MASDYEKQINWLIYKAERLVSALYMVTDLINTNDPIKWQMRKLGVVLLTEIGKLLESPPSERKKIINSAREATAEILSLLEVVANAGLISRMNYSLLKKEFTNTPLLLERVGKADSPKSIGQIQRYSIGHSIGQAKIIKDKKYLSSIGQNLVIQNKVKKEARKSQITKVFASGKVLSLSDLSEMFRDFGSKMIQRDLLDLVKSGVLNKIGNKRWSRYSLANL
ncbi:MAG: hypothetical protein A3D52_00375 [Candidatus Taylorbacteria bacterium RIFCSPHIGHO2_02_FULL_44_36]|uniref:HTH deoR-type domain-containing protein n=1 Tax=Candidatus Taylorbacteria bacterium RIFCSPLOWO2_12_FULL_44_15c TaxID=1802333 RepID=A0A1G2P421_9BACT|nr:MAG: hypothetical protein A3D52_00375 [Candidatus Taylorbacteria bacterium RIFCSPHIGHO2_02_FULL_44_36]OHA39461.1 MAG: hypothetical protein A3I97_01610 [Candidatus Taylorbacteria bacterium RIFCSPLOWO2_02_FULL_44_35]OHA43076.1 MAG: hypothetical protein A3G03_00970 [Candidatus Taylorbacteria bacterium RIFCSPLOWO2_12_FULL_44_15c]